MHRQLGSMPLQFGQIVERIRSVQLAGMNETHEQVPNRGTVQRFVEERVLSIQNGFLQRPFNDVVVDGNPGMLKKKRQLGPVVQ